MKMYFLPLSIYDIDQDGHIGRYLKQIIVKTIFKCSEIVFFRNRIKFTLYIGIEMIALCNLTVGYEPPECTKVTYCSDNT